MKSIKELWLFLVDDTKKDIAFIKDVVDGNKTLNFSWLKFNPLIVIKNYWLFFLIIVLAWSSGWFMASQYYQDLANNFILDFINSTDVTSRTNDFLFSNLSIP